MHHEGLQNITDQCFMSNRNIDWNGRAYSLLDTRLSIERVRNDITGDTAYSAVSSWRVQADGRISEWRDTRYRIDLGDDESVRAAITHPDLVEEIEATRPMVLYDYEQLFDQLNKFYDLYEVWRYQPKV